MPMLYPSEFWDTYGMGARLQDATGREIDNVMAADLETGEVIIWCQLQSPMDWLRIWIHSFAHNCVDNGSGKLSSRGVMAFGQHR